LWGVRPTKYPKVTYRYIGVKLAHLSVSDLYYLKSTLEDYRARAIRSARDFSAR
jgi:hypothetical protein